MNKQIKINNDSSFQKLFSVREQILKWNFEEVKGIGFFRGHDIYAHVEFKIYKSEEQNGYIKWNISDDLFPYIVEQNQLRILSNTCLKLKNYVAAIKGIDINLTFEITNIGFHPTCNWWKASYNAFVNGFISCFNEELYQKNKLKSDNYFKNIDDIKMVLGQSP
ncbi:hypothetical protein [Aureivirga marina]|uniref:hypothetical protein n=1 Tax=Aureivirga marina TaxID=1182451 RepID=UPI0018CBB1D9|nr:hypothetical protein [Aureivirga marina]